MHVTHTTCAPQMIEVRVTGLLMTHPKTGVLMEVDTFWVEDRPVGLRYWVHGHTVDTAYAGLLWRVPEREVPSAVLMAATRAGR